jgi:hypothetical protein
MLILHKIHILDSLSWSPVTTLELSSRIPAGAVSLSTLKHSITIKFLIRFAEHMARAVQMARIHRSARISFVQVMPGMMYFHGLRERVWTDERLHGPQSINMTRTDISKPNPKTGAVQLEWNKTGSLLLVRFGEAFRLPLFNLILRSSEQKTSQQLSTFTLFHQLLRHSTRNCVVFSYIRSRFCMLGGILFVKVA